MKLRFWETQKALVGDAANSLFNSGYAKQPRELATYRRYHDEDSTVGASIDALTNMTCGGGIYVSADDPDETVDGWTQQDAVEEINEFNSRVRLDEVLVNVSKCMRIFGFCPVERVTRRGPPGGILELMVLDPEGVEYQRDKRGVFTGFTQRIQGAVNHVKFGPDELVWFCNKQVGNAKGAMYGVSDIKRVLPLLEIRDSTITNINGILKNQARPPVIWKTLNSNDVATLKAILKECREAGDDVVLYPKDSVEHEVIKIDTRIPYWEYVEYIDGLIFQGLHSPMLNYLRNATEASANIMLDVIKLDVEGTQRYLKRVVEHEFWEHHLRRKGYMGKVPTLNFGAPKTGLEDLQIETFVTKGLELGYLNPEQFYAILKTKGLSLPEPTHIEPPTTNAENPNATPSTEPQGTVLSATVK